MTNDSFNKQHILIVDDVSMNLMILNEALKGEYIIDTASNGKDAISIASSENPPDIILLDIMMPEMDGYEVCKILKQNPETKEIPIVFVTALDEQKDEEYGLTLGAIDYIVKPYSIPIVKARIKNHLELKKYNDFLRECSRIDGLTQIANRRKFDETLLIEWNRAKRLQYPLSVLMIDIDYFKNYNDTYGHLVGDECLRNVAKTISSELRRPGDLAARWGGEEFTAILPQTEHDGAISIAENIRIAIMELNIPHSTSLVHNSITVSIGVATTHLFVESEFEKLLKDSDDALYRAKSMGRNMVFSAHEMKKPIK